MHVYCVVILRWSSFVRPSLRVMSSAFQFLEQLASSSASCDTVPTVALTGEAGQNNLRTELLLFYSPAVIVSPAVV